MDESILRTLASQISQGQVVLFTGAGFSRSARTRAGPPIAMPSELANRLWQVAYGDEPFDTESKLGEIYEVAAARAFRDTQQVLEELLLADPEAVPDIYRVWFAMPWLRAYTLNVDDLDEAAQRRFGLARRLHSVSAYSDSLPRLEDELYSIHLNGRVRDYPDVTFSERQYGERTANPDPWYRFLVGDIAAHPVVFVGTQLDEPPLWQHLALRRVREPRAREHRPRSYLVTRSLGTARRDMLSRFNIEWIEMDQETFASEILATLVEERERGSESIRVRVSTAGAINPLEAVGDVREQESEDVREFLLGREPTWADLTQGYAVERAFERELLEEIDANEARVFLLTGTAGSGKSTTLRRLALAYDASGRPTYWLNLETELPLSRIRRTVGESGATVLCIDDADLFGDGLATFVGELITQIEGLQVLLAVRSAKVDRLNLHSYLGADVQELTVPNLEDGDIGLVLDALTSANRLGRLREMARQEQERVFREYAGRQLLVAMIEATSGERFEARIDRECADLSMDATFIYQVVCLATIFRHGLTNDEVLLALGDITNESLHELQTLIGRHLLVRNEGLVRIRHRVVADRAIDYFKRAGRLADPIQALVFALATKITSDTSRRSRERDLLIRLLSHRFLMSIGVGLEDARRVYASVEDLLDWDYHYWLQRGSLEVKHDQVERARNFLEQARAMEPLDYMVQTEWAYMTLKLAIMEPDAVDAPANVDEAFKELEDAIQRRGRVDPYPYHILGAQGITWGYKGPLTRDDRRLLFGRLLEIVKEGRSHHALSRELDQLATDLERHYLMQGVEESSNDATDEGNNRNR